MGNNAIVRLKQYGQEIERYQATTKQTGPWSVDVLTKECKHLKDLMHRVHNAYRVVTVSLFNNYQQYFDIKPVPGPNGIYEKGAIVTEVTDQSFKEKGVRSWLRIFRVGGQDVSDMNYRNILAMLPSQKVQNAIF